MRRYPGVVPYDIKHKDLFKGRDYDIKSLLNKIAINKTIAVHAASGTGKTSLINAAIFPELSKPDSRYLPVIIRFEGLKNTGNDTKVNENDDALIEEILIELKDTIGNISLSPLPFLLKKENDLWYWAKLLQGIGKDLVFIFDQFEGIESYHYKQINFLKDQLVRVFSKNVPSEYYDFFVQRYSTDKKQLLSLDEQQQLKYDEESSFLKQTLNTKAVFVIRDDKLGTLSSFSDAFPDILKNDFSLKQLDLVNATAAIDIPTYAPGEFESPPFKFNAEAISYILKKLQSENTGLFDPFEIQVICSYVENKLIEDIKKNEELKKEEIELNDDGQIEIKAAYLPPITDIISTFYKKCWQDAQDKLTELTVSDFEDCRKEIIQELVINDRRIQVYHEIFSDNAELVLGELKKCGLVRETTVGRDKYFRLCHDRFISPIVESLKQYKETEDTKRNLKLYKKILWRFTSDEDVSHQEIRNLREVIETRLIVNGKIVQLPYNMILNEYHVSDLMLYSLIKQNLIVITDQADGIYVELSNNSLIDPILNAYRVRKAEEDKAEAENQKKIIEIEKKAKNFEQMILLLIIVCMSAYFVYHQTQSGPVIPKESPTQGNTDESGLNIDEKKEKYKTEHDNNAIFASPATHQQKKKVN